MAGNQVTLTFAGDSKQLERAGQQAEKSVKEVQDSVVSASEDFKHASKETVDYTDKIGKLGAGVAGMSGAVDDAGAAVSALANIQQRGKERASAHAHALNEVDQASNDVKRAAEDLRRANLDLQTSFLDAKDATLAGKDAEIALQRARLDATDKQDAYNKAVKEHGKNSRAAQEAALDLAEANQNVAHATQDSKRAQDDYKSAIQDGREAQRDAAEAITDQKSAQLDLNDAMREAHPPGLTKFATELETVTPILSGLVGIIGLVTAAQWAWNAAQLASPTTWIILAIVALIAVIVLIATKTTWFQTAWKASWGAIKNAAVAVWDWLKALPGRIIGVYASIAKFITAPFRAAFNFIADAWNNTIGRLHWTIPSWVPFIGGNSISVPNIPKFHSGGVVPGAPGSEMLAILQAGETVTPANQSSAGAMQLRTAGNADSQFATFLKNTYRTGLWGLYDSTGQRIQMA